MADPDFQVEEDSHSGTDPTVALFLALFLVILAFFILLVTISTLEEIKSQSVMKSLTSTFATIVPPTTDPTRFQSKDGDILAGHRFQQEVTEIFATAIQVAEVTVVHPGKLMRVRFPSQKLFYDDETNIRRERGGLLDRIVAALSSRPPGLRFDMEMVVGLGADERGLLPVSQTLEMGRAGAFAREMHSRGAPPDSVAIGMEPDREGIITIWFFLRTEEETRLEFESIEALFGRQSSGSGGGG